MNNYKTQQEDFWAGEFGDEYISRNSGDKQLAMKMMQWSTYLRTLKITDKLTSCIEFGPNIGLNLKVIGTLIPGIEMRGVEINSKAVAECRKIPNVEVIQGSILDYVPDKKFDLAFTSGVLIHIAPEELDNVYRKLYESSNKFVFMVEYYNPTPVEIEYRGNTGKLFKRDFAGEFMDMYPEFKLLNYGFIYHRDTICPEDDANWFMMVKDK